MKIEVNLNMTETTREYMDRLYSGEHADMFTTITVHYNDAKLLKGKPSEIRKSTSWLMEKRVWKVIVDHSEIKEKVLIEVK